MTQKEIRSSSMEAGKWNRSRFTCLHEQLEIFIIIIIVYYNQRGRLPEMHGLKPMLGCRRPKQRTVKN
jgi:hypothetical protein